MHFKPSLIKKRSGVKTCFRRKSKLKSSLVILRMTSIVKLKHEVKGRGFSLKRVQNSLIF